MLNESGDVALQINTAPEGSDANQPRAWLYLGTVQHRRVDRKAAIASFRTAVEHKPDYAVAYFDLGLTL